MSSPLLGVAIVEALLAADVRHVVLAPGSRNAPLSLALDAADTAGLLSLHVRVDERVAAFTALGLAKASGTVVAVVTTSGTAVGNLVPAAMEARAAGVPLLFLTADRPATAVGTGANQTCDQLGAFGPAALEVLRLSSASGPETAWRATIARAATRALGCRTRQPGPVQVNVEFDLPLVHPDVPAPRPQRPRPCVAASRRAEVRELTTSARTVVLAGDAPAWVGAEALAAAELAGVPLLAEPSSNARTGPAIPRYRERLAELGAEIERVVVFGHPTLSRPVATLLARQDLELIVVADRAEWIDPGYAAAEVVDGVILPPGDPTWLARWMGPASGPPDALTGEAVAAAVVAAARPGENLVFGASSSIRYADVAPINPEPATCWANRGLAGIDGTLATATGIALATGAPTTVLLGDITLQHDLGALVLPKPEPDPRMRVVLLDDQGGSIFASLEQGSAPYARAFDRVFRAPQGVDLSEAAKAARWRVVNPIGIESVRELLAESVCGRELLHIRI
ncbi:MAG: 2-succinyl-5-enolpyruvyl-6-hydroxy-3-cyclohexene-1-carboxylic-acid synthase [Propionibacteriaceae bacterium]|nr:2-succinyl-5-enolpyruvyl-6-hydroxy-3-cyclohexene-1-carboxylic-acid synthase [Propionibacteriaceae bacterium]